MELKVIGTGSAGNCYILENTEEALIIELGLNFKKIKEALDFNLAKVVGAIATHEHGDHSKGIKDALKNGIDVYASKGTFKALDINHFQAKVIESKKAFTIGGFKILPFDVHHDVNEPLGFLIEHNDCGKTLFLTDTTHCDYYFSGLNNIIIEANYCTGIIQEKLGKEGSGMMFLKDRIIKSHMSIDTCRDTLLANDLTKVNNIVLIHLSDSNSHERNFEKTIKEATGKIVTAARNGQTIKFNKTPF